MLELPLSITEAAAALRADELSSEELTAAALERADACDGVLGVYLARFDEEARSAARRADAELARGTDRGPLHGIPLGVKDILSTEEGPTTANSLVHDRSWGAGADAPVVQRLRAAGAVIVGKVTTMEFAIGSPDFTKPFPIPRNPWDPARWPGGSSSGTGAGVAAGFFLGGLGTDTGGSIRIPAAYCGITGLMPTFGLVPTGGCVPLGYSLDHIGPMARGAADCALMLEVMTGRPGFADDGGSASAAGGSAATLAGLRVGVSRELFEGADPACPSCFEAALEVLRDLGASLEEVALPYYGELVAIDLVTMYSEALAYHLPDLRRRWADFFEGTRTSVGQGALITGADYVQAQRVRRVAIAALRRLYDSVDVIAMPTATQGAMTYETMASPDQGARSMAAIHTPYWDPVGNPVLALPMGFTADGLPLSLQLAGRPNEEARLLTVGRAFQERTGWHRRVPSLQLSAFDPQAARERLAGWRPPAAGDPAMAPVELAPFLAGAGLSVPDDDLPRLGTGTARLRAMVALLHGVAEARYAEPALAFDVAAAWQPPPDGPTPS